MDKFYHFTNYGCVDSINRNGLVPSTGDRCQSIGDPRHGIFLAKGIDRTIIMYAFMLEYYQRYNGDEGLKKRKECLDYIKEFEQENSPFSKYKIDCELEIIKRIDKMRSHGNFINYLGGYGCFLSINELDDFEYNHPEDCFYEGTIPSDKINVVNIVNRFTGQCIYDREAVLSYFMSLYSPDQLINLVPDDNKKDIINLYNCITGYLYYNPNYYYLWDIPINYYYEEPKVKTLTNS